MSSLIIADFSGEATREQKLHTHNTFADCAMNAQLHDGSLRPIPCPEEVCVHAFVPRAIWSSNECDCIANPNETIYAEGSGFVFWSSQGSYSQKSSCFCDGEVLRIGMGYPSVKPSASGNSSGCDFDPHQYYYTYVSSFCNGSESEGPLSPPSGQVCGRASVGGGSAPETGHGITSKRIYRSQAGWKTGEEGGVTNNSGITLVGEVAPDASFSDNISVGGSSAIAPITEDMLTMPSNTNGVGVTAFSVFVWEGNKIYFSTAGMVDVMMPEGEIQFDHNIINAVYWNNSVYVFTTKWNYRIDEQASSGGVVRSNPPHKYEMHAPLHYKYSVTTGASGVYYISKNGIIVLSGNDGANIGSALFPTSVWHSMDIGNAKLHIHQQYLFVTSRKWDYSHIFEIEDGVYSDVRYSNHVRYPYQISATHEDSDGSMLFASGNTVYRFMESTCEDRSQCESLTALCAPCCPYDYVISTRDQAEVLDWASAYVNIDSTYGDVKFTLWDGECGTHLIYEKTLTGCGIHEFKLPAQHSSSAYKTIQLEGCATVYELRLSSSNKLMGLNE